MKSIYLIAKIHKLKSEQINECILPTLEGLNLVFPYESPEELFRPSSA